MVENSSKRKHITKNNRHLRWNIENSGEMHGHDYKADYHIFIYDNLNLEKTVNKISNQFKESEFSSAFEIVRNQRGSDSEGRVFKAALVTYRTARVPKINFEGFDLVKKDYNLSNKQGKTIETYVSGLYKNIAWD